MLSLNMIEKRIHDLQCELIPQDLKTTTIHHGKIDILFWVKNGGELKTKEEIDKKIQRINEELLVLNPQDLFYAEKKARLKELDMVLTLEEY